MIAETPIEAIPRYRRILKDALPEHLLKPDNRHIWWLVLHLSIVAVLLWVLTAHFAWWFAPIASLLIGHSFGSMGFVAHETCHGGAIRNRTLRHLITCVAFSPFAIGAHLWSRWHNAEHHGNTQHPELDPDRLFLHDEYRNNFVLKWLYKRSKFARNVVIFSFFSLMMTQHNFYVLVRYLREKDTSRQEKAVILFQFIAAKTFWIGLTLLLGWKVFLFGYLFPLMVGNAMVISYIATNHFLNPLADESDVLASSLSVTFPKWLSWLDVLHCNFGAHVSHHLFPQAPSRHSREIELKIAELWPERYHVMPFGQAMRLLWQTPWIYSDDGVNLFDPSVAKKWPTLGNGLTLLRRKRKK